MSIMVCVPSRDGNPPYLIAKAVERACVVHGDAQWCPTKNPHGVGLSQNTGVAWFLNGDCSHLMFVEDDVVIPEHAIVRLLELDANVATGCVPGFDTSKYAKPGQPIVMVAKSRRPGTAGCIWHHHWFDGVRETFACGAACMLIRRSVFSWIEFPWFTDLQHWEKPGDTLAYATCDIGFCKRIEEAGLGPILAAGDVRCTHTKTIEVADFITHEDGSSVEVGIALVKGNSDAEPA